MKLPSLQSLLLHSTNVFLRFPLQVLLAILATCISCYLVNIETYKGVLQLNLIKFLFISNLALTLLLASDVYAEVKQFKVIKQWVFRMLAVAICVGLFFMLHPTQNEADRFRLVILGFVFHLLVSFSPFITNNNAYGFWHYNKTLFLRILTSFLYAGVLYTGLSIALLAIEGLFNVTFSYKIYLQLLAFVGICFTTLFFLAGFPENISCLNQTQSYPKGLKIFTQYVLIPLVSIYLAILLVYEIKIAISWQLPKGLVSTLVLGYAVLGILSLLLIYPIKNQDGNGWIKLFSRFFYTMMLPLVLLLILAIVKRVNSYGITEPRYYIIILAVWLSIITIYFLFSKHQHIKFIPISLSLFAIITLYGPQSAFSVAKASQINKLHKFLALKSKTFTDQKNQTSVIRYLVKNHGLVSLQSFTGSNLSELESKLDIKDIYNNKYLKIDTAFAILKVKDINSSVYNTYIFAEKENKNLIFNTNVDYCILISETNQTNTVVNGMRIKVEKINETIGNFTKNKLSVTLNQRARLDFNFNDTIVEILQQCQAEKFKKNEKSSIYILPNKYLKFVKYGFNYKVELVITDFNAEYEPIEKKFNGLNYKGYLLFKKIK
ncbi:MAG: DUF4153 domain-containing protein [Sphingobacteriales bacterium]|nr:MAG: DUF4153 domain-containing protein [Sphingobacteriales bacterium]TAF80049.1 MAG: DUF4153 domain-containing protein [Sphingobacteriales bacterium]